MALDKQLVDLPLVAGVDTRNAEGSNTPNKNEQLQNLRFTYPGSLSSTETFSNAALSPTNGIIAGKQLDDKIILQSTTAIGSVILPQTAGNSQTFAASLPGIGEQTLVSSPAQSEIIQTGTVLLSTKIFLYWVYLDNTGTYTTGYQFLDLEGNKLTGGVISTTDVLCATSGPTTDLVYLWIINGSYNLEAKTVNSSGTVTALTVPAATAFTSGRVIYSSTDSAWWVARIASGPNLVVSKFTISGTTITESISPVTVYAGTPVDFDIIRTSSYVAVGYLLSGTTSHALKYYNTSLVIQSTQTPTSSVGVTSIKGGFGLVNHPTQANVIYMAGALCPVNYTHSGGNLRTYSHFSVWSVSFSSVTTLHNSSSYDNFMMSGKPFIHNDTLYAPCVDIGRMGYITYALVVLPLSTSMTKPEIVTTWCPNTAYPTNIAETYSSRFTNSNVSIYNNKFYIVNAKIGEYSSSAWVGFSGGGAGPYAEQFYSAYYGAVNLFTYNTAAYSAFKTFNTNTAKLICTNLIYNLDPLGIGPNTLWPGQYSLIRAKSGGSLTASVTYQYILERVWRDYYGNIMRVESLPAKITTDATYKSAEIYVHSSQRIFTKYNDTANPCQTNIYRTDANGSVFYYMLSVYSSTTLITDSGYTLNYSRPLGSNSGELPVQTVASPRSFCMWRGRVAALTAENPRTIVYTGPIQAGESPAFRTGLEINISQALNNLVAIESMDGVLYAFTEDQIFTIYGDPAGNTGEGGSVSIPEIRFNGVGCKDARSLILTPKGLIFHSGKGFYLILRNQELVYIGDGPFESREGNVIGAHLDETKGEVSFLFNTTEVGDIDAVTRYLLWIYDYTQNQWFSRLTSLGSSASDVLDYNGDIAITTSNYVTTESGDTEFCQYMSPWTRLGSQQGYQRLYNILLDMDLTSNSNLIIDLFVDYNDTSVYTWTLDTDNITANSPIKLSVPIQKCSAFKIRVYTDSPATINGMTAEIGVKPTLYKQYSGPNNN